MSLITRGLGEPGLLVTRGLGAPGLRTPTAGGVVVEEAERLLADIAIVEELVADVEDALAPVVEALLVDTDVELTLETREALSLALDVSETLEVEITDVELAVDVTETERVSVSAEDSAAADVDTSDADSLDLTALDGSAATIDAEDRLDGEA